MDHFPLESLCGATHRAVVLLTEQWCCFKLQPLPCWLRIGCAVVLASVVLFQAQCVGLEGIVLSSRGYWPRPMYMSLFMLLVSLSAWWQFHTTGSPHSHSHSPLTSALMLQSLNVCGKTADWERVSISDWQVVFAIAAWVGLHHSVYLGWKTHFVCLA